MVGKYIHQAILEFKEAYETAAIAIPQYRITCKEHKDLIEYLKPVAPHKCKQSMISEYYGVQIEVVMIVDAYI